MNGTDDPPIAPPSPLGRHRIPHFFHRNHSLSLTEASHSFFLSVKQTHQGHDSLAVFPPPHAPTTTNESSIVDHLFPSSHSFPIRHEDEGRRGSSIPLHFTLRSPQPSSSSSPSVLYCRRRGVDPKGTRRKSVVQIHHFPPIYTPLSLIG